MKAKQFVLSALLYLHSVILVALDWQDSPEVERLFRNADVIGTFVLYDVTKNRLIGHNRERAYTQFIPASTFKVANILIGLSVGAAKSID
jgi:beta-lactamase class D